MYTCEENIQSVIIHKNKTILPGNPTGSEDQEPYFKWWIGGEIIEFAEPIVEIIHCQSSLGPLSIKSVKKSDFFPIRLFKENPDLSGELNYFTKQMKFEIKDKSKEWIILIEAENCDYGNDENICFGKSNIQLINKKDGRKYNIEVEDFDFIINNQNEIISNLGLRFDDFNFDGQNDFGYGFDVSMYEGLLPKVYLMSQDGKRLEDNKEFNKLILGGGENGWYDLSKRTFEFFSTFSYGHEYIKYYLCPSDSLNKFKNYEIPKELEGYKLRYPNTYLTSYSYRSDNVVKKFDFFSNPYFLTDTLDEIEYGELDDSYTFTFENSDITNYVEKIDSATFYKAYENIVPNPFLLKEKEILTELELIKKNKESVSKRKNELKIECTNGEKKSFKNNEDSGQFFKFYGLTEDNNFWIIREYGGYDSHSQMLINKATCKVDSLDGFPRYSPNGNLVAIGEYLEEDGVYGFLSIYEKNNNQLKEIGKVIMDNLEYSFAPYEMFWVDNKTLYVKKLKTNGMGVNDFYFEYGKITIDYFNTIKK